MENFNSKNGLNFVIRPIKSDDKKLLVEGFKSLSSETIHQRFQFGKSGLNNDELKKLTEIDHLTHLAFVTGQIKDQVEKPAGVIRGVKDSKRPSFLEIALTIVDEFQGLGLGLKLLNLLKEEALKLGYSHFCGELHSSNLKMLKLLQKFNQNQNFTLTHIGDGFLSFEIPLKS